MADDTERYATDGGTVERFMSDDPFVSGTQNLVSEELEKKPVTVDEAGMANQAAYAAASVISSRSDSMNLEDVVSVADETAAELARERGVEDLTVTPEVLGTTVVGRHASSLERAARSLSEEWEENVLVLLYDSLDEFVRLYEQGDVENL